MGLRPADRDPAAPITFVTAQQLSDELQIDRRNSWPAHPWSHPPRSGALVTDASMPKGLPVATYEGRGSGPIDASPLRCRVTARNGRQFGDTVIAAIAAE